MLKTVLIVLLAVGVLGGSAGRALADGCPRPAAGGVVLPPPELASIDGVLNGTLHYVTATDAAGRSLFCFQTPTGQEAPTLRVSPGDTLKLKVHNDVPASPTGSPMQMISADKDVCGSASMTGTSVNIHFHGTNASPACGADQVIYTLINSGREFDYNFPLPADEPSGLYWYHPHVHGIAETAVQGGASGLIVVRGIEQVVPALAGIPERLLIIRDQVVAGQPAPGGAVPSWDLTINGVPIAYPEEVPAIIQTAGGSPEFWRVANASADSLVDLQVVYDGVVQPLDLVALDGVALGSQDGTRRGKPQRMTHIFLPTAGRAEFVVPPAPRGTKVAQLRTLAIDTGPGGDSDPARTLATLVVTPHAVLPMAAAATAPPSAQRFEGLDAATVTAHRKLYFSEVLSDPTNPASPTNFFITVDGAKPVLFDPDLAPAIVTHKGAVEDWTVENRSGEVHEFHIHQIHFKVLAANGTPVPLADRQFRDTIQIPYWSGSGPYPSVTFRLDFRGMVVGDYVYHCHILGHEDNGMMAIIQVLPPAS